MAAVTGISSMRGVVILAIWMVYVTGSCVHKKFEHIAGHTGCIDLELSNVEESGVSEGDQTTIVDLHNQLRASVNASNMQKLIWDDEIAQIAQIWANNCDYQHDTARSIPGRFYVGQNLGLGQNTWQVVIQAWYDEINLFTYGGSNSLSDVGHFTQVTWAETSKIGCGYALCTNLATGNFNGKFFACNYGPGGNTGSGYNTPYELTGGACSACSSSCDSSRSICNCEGKTCYNGGTLDPNTCLCSCVLNDYLPEDCSLNCTDISDSWACPQYGKSGCTQFANVPDECPTMCGTCPYGGIDYMAPTNAPGWGGGDGGDGEDGDNTGSNIYGNLQLIFLMMSFLYHSLL